MSGDSKLYGDWKAAIARLDKVGENVRKATKVATLQNAMMLVATIVKHFQNQDLGWAGLDAAYKKWKKKKGYSTQTLIMTSSLMNSITHKLKDDGMSAIVGVLRNAKRKDGKAAVMIAAVHEFGSAKRGIPARPYIRPSFQEKKEEMKNRYRKKISEALAAK